jgi:peptide/nickel transport system permease protein
MQDGEQVGVLEHGTVASTEASTSLARVSGTANATRFRPFASRLDTGVGSLRLWRRFRRHRLAIGGAIVILVLTLCSIAAPLLTPYSPNAVNLALVARPPTMQHLLGTDLVGRDVLTRLLYAGRVSLSVGLVAVGIYTAIGILLGGISGFRRGWVDQVIMRITDTVLCFPTLVIIIVIVSMVGPSIYNVMLVIGLLGWPSMARLVRGQFLSLRETDFVLAARGLGAGDARIIFRHILPSVVGPIIVAATFGIAVAILTEASLSFLGLGVQPPAASWGNMLNQAKAVDIIENKEWLWVPPGALVALCVLSINFIGDGLRDALDTRSRMT